MVFILRCGTDGSGNFLAPPTPNRDGSVSPSPGRRERTSSVTVGRPHWLDVQMAQRIKIPHTFVIHTYTRPTKCFYCNKMLVGVYKQVRNGRVGSGKIPLKWGIKTDSAVVREREGENNVFPFENFFCCERLDISEEKDSRGGENFSIVCCPPI